MTDDEKGFVLILATVTCFWVCMLCVTVCFRFWFEGGL